MDLQSSGSAEPPQMLPPPPGRFASREELIEHAGDFAVSQGYVVTIKWSKKDKVVVLGCDRGGVYRNRRKTAEMDSVEEIPKPRNGSRLTNCPFELLGKKEDDVWILTVKNGVHNHEPLKDISEHPYARRFTEDEILQVKEMTEAGLKPRQILKRLRESNPELSSTPRHVYNVKAKLRQGNFTVRNFTSLRPQSLGISQHPATSEQSWSQRFPRATQQVVYLLPLTTIGEFKAAALAAKQAFPSWRNTPVTTRQRVILKLRELIQRDMDKLAANITSEEGKTLKDAYRDLYNGLEVLEHICGVATSQMGQFVSDAANGVDVYSIREPLGVCAGICLSNFPAIIALWMFPVAIICGNTFILKSSVKNPGLSTMLAELVLEAGLPNGILNIVHGTDEIVNAICDDDDVKGISFAASRRGGMHVYSRASAKGKRIQSYTEGRSHMVVMPDANMDVTVKALVPAAFRADGERCFALGTVIFVGDSKPWESKLVELAQVLKVNAGTEPDVDIGPMLSKQEKEKICKLIQGGIERGARPILDGRNIVVPGYEQGNFIGPTILCDITADMECYKEEIYGPLLLCMQVNSLEEAISIVNKCRYCNGVSIFTNSGASAKKFRTEVEVGQVGVNVPVSIPMPFISSSDLEASSLGRGGVLFYTKMKTVRERWVEFPSGCEPCLPKA